MFSQRFLVQKDTRCQPVVACNLFKASSPLILIRHEGPSLASLPRPTCASLRSPEGETCAFHQFNLVPVEECLLTRVMRLVCPRFGWYFCWFFFVLKPFGVENAGFVDAFIRMGSKEIALRLQEISRKTSRAITVVIRQ